MSSLGIYGGLHTFGCGSQCFHLSGESCFGVLGGGFLEKWTLSEFIGR